MGGAVVLIALAAVYFFGDRTDVVVRRTARDGGQLGSVSMTIPVQRRDIVSTITATGNVLPARSVDLRFSGSGRVREVHVSEGERVEAGGILATLDNRQQELNYIRARNAYEAALIDSAPNVVREREIDMELARDSLEQTYLRAPFSGVVTQLHVEPGQSVTNTDLVVQLIDDSAFEVRVDVDELDIAKVRPGQSVSIRLDADPSTPRSGVVDDVSLVANMQGTVVTVPVTVRFLEPDPFLRPGYTATLQITVAESLDTLVIPVDAVWEDGDVRTVTRVVDGQEERVTITTGLTDGLWVEVLSGLEAGDEIVALNYRGGPSGGNVGFGGGIPRQVTGGGPSIRIMGR